MGLLLFVIVADKDADELLQVGVCCDNDSVDVGVGWGVGVLTYPTTMIVAVNLTFRMGIAQHCDSTV